jgi:large subunit ribosomal protein L13
MVIIDATDLVVGRLSTHAAKNALLGETVHVVNCEKAIITGRKSHVIAHQKHKHDRGSMAHGPYIHRSPEKFVKRAIRGMIPYKQSKGRDALDRIKCHIGVPKSLEGKETVSYDDAHAKALSTDFGTVGAICKELGGKW